LKPSYDPNALERRVRQKIQGVMQTFWVVCHPGFERTIATEIDAILAGRFEKGTPVPSGSEPNIQVHFGGVEFQGRIEDCWRINALARTPSRISMRIDEFRATQFPELVRKVSEIPWELYLSPHAKGQIQVTSRNSRLIHTDAVEERVGAGIQQRLAPWRDALPEEPGKHELPQTILVRLENDRCTLSIDASGELLFKRGFDKFTEDAPLRDTLAACILQKAGWEKMSHLIDPMAGSGTFTLEALLARAPHHFPGLVRRFCFEEWPNFRVAAYNHLLKSLGIPVDKAPLLSITTCDIDSKAVQTIRANLDVLKLSSSACVQLRQQDFFTFTPEVKDPAHTLVVLNPPYGVRLPQGTYDFYKHIGEHLRKHFRGCRFAIVCPSPEDAEALELRWEHRQISKNGGLEIGVVIGWVS